MIDEAVADERALESAAVARPEPPATAVPPERADGQRPAPPALVMIDADDVQACAVDGTCW